LLTAVDRYSSDDMRMMADRMPPDALLEGYPTPIVDLAQALRRAVRRASPDVTEGVRAGWRVLGLDAHDGRRSAYFAWIMIQREHVHLGFVYGVYMRDPERQLGGDAKLARWTTHVPGEVTNAERLAPLIREGRRVALLPRVLRAEAAALDGTRIADTSIDAAE
jgi:hypothetical protein